VKEPAQRSTTVSESYTASFHNGGMEKDGIDSSGRKRSKLIRLAGNTISVTRNIVISRIIL